MLAPCASGCGGLQGTDGGCNKTVNNNYNYYYCGCYVKCCLTCPPAYRACRYDYRATGSFHAPAKQTVRRAVSYSAMVAAVMPGLPGMQVGGEEEVPLVLAQRHCSAEACRNGNVVQC